MSDADYVPGTVEARDAYVAGALDWSWRDMDQEAAAFDRWLAGERAAAKAEALEDVFDGIAVRLDHDPDSSEVAFINRGLYLALDEVEAQISGEA